MQVERSADANPGQAALACGGRCLTYAEIETLANKLAQARIEGGLVPKIVQLRQALPEFANGKIATRELTLAPSEPLTGVAS
jgi:non-ribosomal peptide synthetase component E (peptide arylation enzyme)